jgi:Arylsulfotransferase (ASST)
MGAFLSQAFTRAKTHHLSQFFKVASVNPGRVFTGYRLANGYLIDVNGKIIKTWSAHHLGLIDNNGDYYGSNGKDAPFWGRYSWNDQVIWEKHFPIHHEIYLSPLGTIFTFGREIHNYNNYKVSFDTILEFDKSGNELQHFSLWEHRQEFQAYHAKFGIDIFSPFFLIPPMYLWEKFADYQHQPPYQYDYFHLNSFFIVPPNALEKKSPAFQRGNWLISMFHGSMVFILDPVTKKILWHLAVDKVEGGFDGQHSVTMLPDGNILLFENGVCRGASRILIINPLTSTVKWQYSQKGFYSEWEGSVQALPNGNFLVTESTKGHAFELTPDKQIVWEYYNNGDDIYRMTCYPKDMIDRFLSNQKDPI